MTVLDPPQASPFLKWAGSKRLLLDQILPHVPGEFGRYYEPFLGSGALFFALQPKSARLSDANEALMKVYISVRDEAGEVHEHANAHERTREAYYELRDRSFGHPAEAAGAFIYLNKMCFNGLYRVNLKGRFNVPWGAPKSDFVTGLDHLRSCQAVLRRPGVTLATGDFDANLRRAAAGSLVFLDPPYVTRHNRNGFVHYNEKIFSWSDQQRLASTAEKLRRRGAHVLVTNALHADVLSLYPNFESHAMSRFSHIAGSRDKRGPVHEALLVGKV